MAIDVDLVDPEREMVVGPKSKCISHLLPSDHDQVKHVHDKGTEKNRQDDEKAEELLVGPIWSILLALNLSRFHTADHLGLDEGWLMVE